MPPAGPIKINCDLGEAFGNYKCGPDDELLPLIDHANVGCGFHGGDPMVMMETVKKAKHFGVKVGAHPGLPDLQGFGRREMKITPEEGKAMVMYQIGALKQFLEAEDMPLHHVKPHGVFYAMMNKDYDLAVAVCEAIPKGVPLFVHAGTVSEKAAKAVGVPYWNELCMDIRYKDGGDFVLERKKKPYSLEDIKLNTTLAVEKQKVPAIEGVEYYFPTGDNNLTLCAHSDTPGCVEVVKAMREIVDKHNAKYYS
ncbi:LamB/YcsF [Aureobasidium pullulans]|nr:LamB/YcsF [Aureobasidium pullulans]